jgi:hypothetical protein
MPAPERRLSLPRPAQYFLFAALLLWLLFSLLQLLQLGFARSSSWPEYSTYRSDRQGAKALLLSLQRMPGLQVERNFRESPTINVKGATVLWLGHSVWWPWPSRDRQKKRIESFLRQGARVVLALSAAPPAANYKPDEERKLNDQQISLRIEALPAGQKQADSYFFNSAAWLHFDKYATNQPWTCLLERGGHCRAAQRQFLGGELVIVSDGHLFANRSLADPDKISVLTKLIGPRRRIVIDEEHLGLEESSSVGGLIRNFRLEGAVLSLLLIAALFWWRSASSLLPRRAVDPPLARVDTNLSMVRLLERAIPTKDLAAALREEWKRSRTLLPHRLSLQADAAAGALSPDNPVAAFNNAASALKRKPS